MALDKKSKTALFSVFSNTLLVIVKLIAGIVVGSVAIISEALHSLNDLVASLIAFYSLRVASVPPDEEHQFGHGKAESIAATIEAILIFGAAFVILYEAIKRIISGKIIMTSLHWGLAAIAFSAVANFFVSYYLFKVAKKTDSAALSADAYHLRTDVYLCLGVFTSLIIIRITKINILDPVIAIGVALYTCKMAFDISKISIQSLMDIALPSSEQKIVASIIEEHWKDYVEYHNLRTRKSGSERQIDLHLVVSKNLSVDEAHKFCEHLEEDIKKKIPAVNIVIHIEPG